MDDFIKQIADKFKLQLEEKTIEHKTNVIDSQQYQEQLKYLTDFSFDAIQTIRHISLYSRRAKSIYDNFLIINASDDILQSIIGIRSLVINGIHNNSKREIRYLLEMLVKYLLVDQRKSGSDIKTKTQYLTTDIPNSSIEIVDQIAFPFDAKTNKELKNEIKDIFYKSCAYVHPSAKQLNEQLTNYGKGNTIGFESAKSFATTNKIIFRIYDILLTMLFIGFGNSMSNDLFTEIYNEEPKWKFHKGKYVKNYSALLNYKQGR